MSYGILRVDKHQLLVDMKQATDIKEAMDELAEIMQILGVHIEFDQIEAAKNQLSVVFLIMKLNKNKNHEIALLSTRIEGMRLPLFKGAFLDGKTFERSEARDFFEVMADFYNAIQLDMKAKIKDLDILIDMALEQKERHWFYELTYKRKRLTLKLNPT